MQNVICTNKRKPKLNLDRYGIELVVLKSAKNLRKKMMGSKVDNYIQFKMT